MKLRLLTAQRGAEVMGMEWDDVDSEAGWWTIPGAKTKNGLAHRVPPSKPALAIVKEMKSIAGQDDYSWFVFPSPKRFPILAIRKRLWNGSKEPQR
jgi:integrase